MTPISIAAYMALFCGLGFLFLFGNLVIGRVLRPDSPNAEKLEVYECGEPTIGSSFVQFDLRFYVVALLFIIFDVEVAVFFPWATVYGKATNMMAEDFHPVSVAASAGAEPELTPAGISLYRELGIRQPAMPQPDEGVYATAEEGEQAIRAQARQLALISIIDIGVFFAVLMVGFFYVWKRGDLDWVRALSKEKAGSAERDAPYRLHKEEPALAS